MQVWGATLVVLFSFCSTSHADEPADLRLRAQKEIRQTGQIKSQPSDATVSGSMLSLKDPLAEVRGRSWDYFLRFSLQNFAPIGTGGNDLSDNRFNMKAAGRTVLPSLTFGIRNDLVTLGAVKSQWGVGGRVAYIGQRSSATFSTGFKESDANLNSTMISANPALAFSLVRLPSLALLAGAEFGSVNYTQSSGNKLASFSEHGNYSGWSTGLEYTFSPHWSALGEYVQRRLSAASQIGIQRDNFELGTRLSW